jgi:AbrB family looped-hinge helix DNA binding protein
MSTKTAASERISRVGQRGQVVIPREMVESLNLREGDLVSFRRQANGVLVKPKRVVDPDDELTPAEARKVRRGMQQFREGHFKLWRDVKHELGR